MSGNSINLALCATMLWFCSRCVDVMMGHRLLYIMAMERSWWLCWLCSEAARG